MRDFSFLPPESILKSREWQTMCQVIRTLNLAGYRALLAGGAVRDMLLGYPPKDFDIATDATPEQVIPLFDRAIPLGASFGVVTVVLDGFTYEVATFREEREYCDGRHPETVCYTKDPVIDAARRDFTVNALFYDTEHCRILDSTGGMDDLKRGILRTVGNPVRRFQEDHLRILRAIRFSSRLGYELEDSTKQAIRQFAATAALVSQERIRDELEKMLLHSSREKAFRLMAETGLLKVILPEADAMRGVAQPEQFHPEGDVFEHTMLMLSHIAYPSPALVWSVLLHDVAKPVTRTEKDGIPHFYGHEAAGADMAKEILKRLRLPNTVIDSVEQAVRNHMRFAHIDKMRPAKWRRIAADPNFPLELELHRIDCISCHGFLDNYHLMLDRLRQLEQEAKTNALPPPFLTGKDLIGMGMKPGPEMGILLQEIMDRQLENEIKTKEDAVRFAKQRLSGFMKTR